MNSTDPKALTVIFKNLRKIVKIYSLGAIAEHQKTRGDRSNKFDGNTFKATNGTSVPRKWESYDNMTRDKPETKRASPVTVTGNAIYALIAIANVIVQTIDTRDQRLGDEDPINELIAEVNTYSDLLNAFKMSIASGAGQEILSRPNISPTFIILPVIEKIFEGGVLKKINIVRAKGSISRFYLDILRIVSWNIGTHAWLHKTYTVNEDNMLSIIYNVLTMGDKLPDMALVYHIADPVWKYRAVMDQARSDRAKAAQDKEDARELVDAPLGCGDENVETGTFEAV